MDRDSRNRFEAEVLTHLDAAVRFACWLSVSRTDAEDLVQDAVLRAFRGFDRLRGTEVKAWLLTIVRNCYLTAVQRRRREAWVALPGEADAETAPELVETADGPEAASMQRDAQRSFARLLARLAPEHREILVLREIEDLGYQEIATITNVPIGTVMSRLARARAALRAAWFEERGGDKRAARQLQPGDDRLAREVQP